MTSEKQLDIRASWPTIPANQTKLFTKLGWKVPPTSRVYTSCITANRPLTGYRLGAHPVRQAHEFINVVSSGTVRLVGHDQPERSFWRGNEFHADDLVDYLEGNSVVQAQIGALIPAFRSFDFRGRILAFEEFALSMEDAVRIIDEQFRIVPVDDDSPKDEGSTGSALNPATEDA